MTETMGTCDAIGRRFLLHFLVTVGGTVMFHRKLLLGKARSHSRRLHLETRAALFFKK